MIKEGEPLTLATLETGPEYAGAGAYLHGLFRSLQEKVRKNSGGNLDDWVSGFDREFKNRSQLAEIAKRTGIVFLGGKALVFLPEWLDRNDGIMRLRIAENQGAIEETEKEESKIEYQKAIAWCQETLAVNQILRQKLEESGKIASE